MQESTAFRASICILFSILCSLHFSSCYQHEPDAHTIRIEIDFKSGYIWDSDTHIRQPFTNSNFGGFMDDGKITLYSDIYQFLPETVIVNDCMPDTYRATNFGNPTRTILQPSNVIEIALGGNCFGRTFGTTFTIDVDIFYEFGCP